MDAVSLERAPKIAVYTPPNAPPWDDAVTLALKYAGIEYTPVWDDEVQRGDLTKYDWLHLHHEDFTGQLNKLYLGFRDAPWFVEQRERRRDARDALGFTEHPGAQEGASPRRCGSTSRTAASSSPCAARRRRSSWRSRRTNVDIAGSFRRRDAHRRQRRRRSSNWKRAFAFQNAHIEQSPFVNSMSDIDGHQVNVPGRRQPLGQFTLFGFSAKFDPVAACWCRTTGGHPRLLRRDDQLQQADAQAGRRRDGERRRRAVGEVHPRRLRQGLVDVPRRARSRGSAAQRSATRRRTCRCTQGRSGTG